MKTKIILLLLICLTSCSTNKFKDSVPVNIDISSLPEHSVKHITSNEAYDMMNDLTDFFIIDVRENYEFAQGHIPNAVNCPLGDVVNNVLKVTDDKDAILFVYCRSGKRSATAADLLNEFGFKNVYDVGGIESWSYEIVK